MPLKGRGQHLKLLKWYKFTTLSNSDGPKKIESYETYKVKMGCTQAICDVWVLKYLCTDLRAVGIIFHCTRLRL